MCVERLRSQRLVRPTAWRARYDPRLAIPHALLSAYDVPGLKNGGFALQANTSMATHKESAMAFCLMLDAFPAIVRNQAFWKTGPGVGRLRRARAEAAFSGLGQRALAALFMRCSSVNPAEQNVATPMDRWMRRRFLARRVPLTRSSVAAGAKYLTPAIADRHAGSQGTALAALFRIAKSQYGHLLSVRAANWPLMTVSRARELRASEAIEARSAMEADLRANGGVVVLCGLFNGREWVLEGAIAELLLVDPHSHRSSLAP